MSRPDGKAVLEWKDKVTELSAEIEKLPASPHQTLLSCMASELHTLIQNALYDYSTWDYQPWVKGEDVEVYEGEVVVAPDASCHLRDGGSYYRLGGLVDEERWRGKRIRVTVEEIPE